MNKAYLRRERFHGSGNGYTVRIRGELLEDDGLRVEMGPVTGVWFEAGYVPGTRKCLNCGSMF